MKNPKQKIINASGKRKTAIAKVVVKKGIGRIRINRIPIEIFTHELARLKMYEPLYLIGDLMNQVDIDVNVKGGGVIGQADATRTAIARGLVEYFDSPELKEHFLKYDRKLLINDPRRKEPKHPLGRGARSKRQKSYR